MYKLSSLLSQLPQIPHPQLISQGYGVWIIWEHELPDSIPETLRSYGGWQVAQSGRQALWVFNSREVLFACAQIYKWFCQEGIKLSLLVFPVKIFITSGLEHSLVVDDKIYEINVGRLVEFEVWMHVRLKEAALGYYGLKFEAPTSSFMPYSGQWFILKVGESSSFTTELNWLFIVKPAAASSVAGSTKNWEQQKKQLISDAHRDGFSVDDKGEYLSIEIEGIRQLKSWVILVLSVFQELKPGKIIACHLVCLELKKNKKTFWSPDKLGLDWAQASPDTLYIPLKHVFQLGHGFEIVDENISREKSINAFVGLKIDINLIGDIEQRIDVFMPESLTKGNHDHCFYCGLRLHKLQTCPSRNMFTLDQVWDQLAKLNLADLSEALEQLGREIESGVNPEEILRKTSSVGLIMRAILVINYPAQHRTIRMVWRSRGRDWPEALRQLSNLEENPVWSALENFRMRQIGVAEASAKKIFVRYSRDFQPKNLLGFIALEKENEKEAVTYFDEAIALSYTPLQKAWHTYLKARMKEVQNDLGAAQSLYQDALKAAPGMNEARYRQGVCMVKAGHIDQALAHMGKLIRDDPVYFTHVIIDPELFKGHAHFMSGLHSFWQSSLKESQEAEDFFPKLENKINNWFGSDHPAGRRFLQRLEFLRQFSGIDNYAARIKIIKGVRELSNDISHMIEQEVLRVKKETKALWERLKRIKNKVSWFPLMRIFMGKFNRVYTSCANNLKKAGKTDPGKASGFRQIQEYIKLGAENVAVLEKRIAFITTVGDGLFFVLLMFRSFLWTLVIVLLISAAVIPGVVYLGMRTESEWALTFFSQRIDVFNIGLIVISIFSLGWAAVRTVLSFEKKKSAYLRKKGFGN
ncbi:tetratricopeptide repeat protein [Desulfonatronovibrio magnus]|uniref:tetratricopeptide repeat protein n=1 Tax=Desulfonatronovibrio magnus TaxID=698827 RepID=UPI0005EBA938|nr:tetratricopeptide repeat protein [Desulfonatronovibrio magnus]